ncbi:aldose 1-epimerase [Cellulophaga sp. F20128]|uniref:aldose epimerase family protein n=1 Tax=Cellulophaga sp. F20128 TaxID=2926413 RepID=UPI001FF45BE6|nr:aldose 1-epimerase [Cellulophaga sp. F20128]
MITLKLANQTVKLDQGELVSYAVNEYEYIHQKGSPGWGSSDTEMFPVIGPTVANNFKVRTPIGDAVQDQHGILRELAYELVEQSATTAIFQKKYTANTKVTNSKYPEKSSVNEVHWPYDFQFQKTIHLNNEGVEITFKIKAEEGMPFMFGYHPAFKTESSAIAIEVSASKSVTVSEIQEAGSRAYYVANNTTIVLKRKQPLEIKTEGFGQFMFWTEVGTMVCIEPITFYPYDTAQDKLSKGYDYMEKDVKIYKVYLKPNKN